MDESKRALPVDVHPRAQPLCGDQQRGAGAEHQGDDCATGRSASVPIDHPGGAPRWRGRLPGCRDRGTSHEDRQGGRRLLGTGLRERQGAGGIPSCQRGDAAAGDGSADVFVVERGAAFRERPVPAHHRHLRPRAPLFDDVCGAVRQEPDAAVQAAGGAWRQGGVLRLQLDASAFVAGVHHPVL